jgi:hypothetical protein
MLARFDLFNDHTSSLGILIAHCYLLSRALVIISDTLTLLVSSFLA